MKSNLFSIDGLPGNRDKKQQIKKSPIKHFIKH